MAKSAKTKSKMGRALEAMTCAPTRNEPGRPHHGATPVMLNSYTGIVPETGSQAEPIKEMRSHVANRLAASSAVRETLGRIFPSNEFKK
jgi:hypothetical protein